MSKTRLRIALLCTTLTTGGAETFVLRLASALHAAGHDVSVLVLRRDRVEWEMVRTIAPDVRVLACETPFLRWVQRLDGALYLAGGSTSIERSWQCRWLQRVLRDLGAQVLHSHLMTSDLVAARACAAVGIPWVTTMHGDYIDYEREGRNRAARIQDFGECVSRIETSVSAIVCISEVQRKQVARVFPKLTAVGKVRKIYNGYPQPTLGVDVQIVDELRRIPEDALVIGMVARGIREKGWDVLLQAWRQAQLKDSWLVLVGDGPRIAELREEELDSRVVFAGNVLRPLDWIARFDIACLPTRYLPESLPTVVIEYLALDKPVVATDVGEIAAMLRAPGPESAGELIALSDEGSMAAELAILLRKLASSPDLRAGLIKNSQAAFAAFDMRACLRDYCALYAEVIG